MKFRRLTAIHAEALGMTPTQVVELGKVLSNDPKLGDDLQAARRGPGGGPDATPYNVTKVVLAGLANGPQTRAGDAVFSLYNTSAEGSDPGVGGLVGEYSAEPPHVRCSITGALFFGEAIGKILADSALADGISHIEARRSANDARIVARDGRVQRFVDDYTARQLTDKDARGELRVVATIGGVVLAEIARDLAEG